jgi:hypothetical protein
VTLLAAGAGEEEKAKQDRYNKLAQDIPRVIDVSLRIRRCTVLYHRPSSYGSEPGLMEVSRS